MNVHMLVEQLLDATDEDSTWARRLRAATKGLDWTPADDTAKYEEVVATVAPVLAECWPDLSAREVVDGMYYVDAIAHMRRYKHPSHRSGYRDRRPAR